MPKLFAVWDTETTGLTIHPDASIDKQPRVIEFGGIITDGESVLKQLEFICDPEIMIEEIITKITGLTNETLEKQKPFNFFIPQLDAFFMDADVSIAHNLSFDRDMLRYDLARQNMSLADISYPEIQCCTVEQTFHQLGRRAKLEELYNITTGQRYVQKHRALDDVMLLHEVCKAMGVYDAFSAT